MATCKIQVRKIKAICGVNMKREIFDRSRTLCADTGHDTA